MQSCLLFSSEIHHLSILNHQNTINDLCDFVIMGNHYNRLTIFFCCHLKQLIVIDTLQKVRETCTDNTYARDYADLARLKELADRCKTTVLLVHHLRKQYDSCLLYTSRCV